MRIIYKKKNCIKIMRIFIFWITIMRLKVFNCNENHATIVFVFLQIWCLILVWPLTRRCFGHLQHAVALLLYGAVTADVKLAELLLWAENHIKSVYWLVRKETLLSEWRRTSPRPRGQTLQTLSGVSDETGGPSENKTQTHQSTDPRMNESVWHAKSNSLRRVIRSK